MYIYIHMYIIMLSFNHFNYYEAMDDLEQFISVLGRGKMAVYLRRNKVEQSMDHDAVLLFI